MVSDATVLCWRQKSCSLALFGSDSYHCGNCDGNGDFIGVEALVFGFLNRHEWEDLPNQIGCGRSRVWHFNYIDRLLKASYIANTHQIPCQNVSKLFSSTRGIYQKFNAAGWELANEQPRHIRSCVSFYPSTIKPMSGYGWSWWSWGSHFSVANISCLNISSANFFLSQMSDCKS